MTRFSVWSRPGSGLALPAILAMSAWALPTRAEDSDPALLKQARAHLATHQFQAAAALLEASAESEQASREVLETLGVAYFELGGYDDAKAIAERLDTSSPRPETLILQARLAETQGEIDQAIDLWTKAIAAKRSSLASVTELNDANALAEFHTQLGQLALTYDKLDLASQQFRAAIKLVNDAHMRLHELNIPHDESDPRMFAAAATAGLAQLFEAEGHEARAQRTWRGVAARTTDPAILARLVRSYLAQADQRSADRIARRLFELTGENPRYRRDLARFLADRGQDLDHALSLAEAEASERRDIDTLDTLAWVLYQQQQYDRAAEIIAKALQTGSKDPWLHYHAGRIFLALDQADKARAHLEQALEVNPNFDPQDAQDAHKILSTLKSSR